MNTQNSLVSIDIMLTTILIALYIVNSLARGSKQSGPLFLLAVAVSLLAIPLEGIPHRIVVTGYISITTLAFVYPKGLHLSSNVSAKIIFGLAIFVTIVTGFVMSIDSDRYMEIFYFGFASSLLLVFQSLLAPRKA